MDYLGNKDFEAIVAIANEDPLNIGIMAASTPTGRRAKFFEICTEQTLNQDVPLKDGPRGEHYDTSQYNRAEAAGWKEFHFTSEVNPNWGPHMESEMRAMFTDVAYQHEVMAEFGSETIGVFNKDYVDEASDSMYEFHEKPIPNGGPVTIGIDWDIDILLAIA